VTNETFSMSQALAATQMALAREQRLSVLGGVVAAAAHELGTPLATIKLASTELIDELDDRPQLQEDARLVRDQADRCSEILRAMGPRGKEDALVRQAPFSSVIEEAAAPHAERGIRIVLRVEGGTVDEGPEVQPLVPRRPEIIAGLRNLIQNAVDFARTTVWIDLDWNSTQLRVVVGDDGPGYPSDLIGRLGDPFVRGRPMTPVERPGYVGMGLGLFIAKTLLEGSGARLHFSNGLAPDGAPVEFARPSGAVVTVSWPRTAFAEEAAVGRGALGENVPVQG
jgi:two-component system sensor histidine kinase RegB